jgi:hypothetical protein
MANYNWEGRSIQSFGPKFRIDLANPQMGFNGADVYNLYGVSDNNDVCLTGLTEGGTYRIYNDKEIEIVAGNSNAATPGVDIVITGKNGDICITAEGNGRVRIKAQHIMIEADEDIDMKAGRNINLNAGSGRVLLKANKADCAALTGNLAPKVSQFGLSVFQGSFVGADILESVFSAVAANITGV